MFSSEDVSLWSKLVSIDCRSFVDNVTYIIPVGYHERAFGCLQAIVEFTLFQPRSLRSSEDTSFGDLIEEFCEFWDTEVARFGEEVWLDRLLESSGANNDPLQGAKGWHHYYSTKNGKYQRLQWVIWIQLTFLYSNRSRRTWCSKGTGGWEQGRYGW